MLQYGNDLMGPVGQQTSGAFHCPVRRRRSKAARLVIRRQAMRLQREQAMGRIGLVYRGVKRWWAETIRPGSQVQGSSWQTDMQLAQSPDAAGDGRDDQSPGRRIAGQRALVSRERRSVSRRIGRQKSAAYKAALVAAADQNPLLAQILSNPRNLETAQRLIGLGDDLEIPRLRNHGRSRCSKSTSCSKASQQRFLIQQWVAQLQQQLAANGAAFCTKVGLHPDVGAIEQLGNAA